MTGTKHVTLSLYKVTGLDLVVNSTVEYTADRVAGTVIVDHVYLVDFVQFDSDNQKIAINDAKRLAFQDSLKEELNSDGLDSDLVAEILSEKEQDDFYLSETGGVYY